MTPIKRSKRSNILSKSKKAPPAQGATSRAIKKEAPRPSSRAQEAGAQDPPQGPPSAIDLSSPTNSPPEVIATAPSATEWGKRKCGKAPTGGAGLAPDTEPTIRELARPRNDISYLGWINYEGSE